MVKMRSGSVTMVRPVYSSNAVDRVTKHTFVMGLIVSKGLVNLAGWGEPLFYQMIPFVSFSVRRFVA
jgi:hypothetical protein